MVIVIDSTMATDSLDITSNDWRIVRENLVQLHCEDVSWEQASCKVLLLTFRWSLFLCVVVVSYFLCNCARGLYFSGYALMYISCNSGECCESVP